jgi:hypothetical protein
MGHKDIMSKDLVKQLALDLARVLLGLKVEGAEIVETQTQRVEERRADLVARMWGEGGEFIFHVEISNDNQEEMPWRMLRYRCDIALSRPGQEIRQYLVYIGDGPLTMADGIEQSGLSYHYQRIDMRQVDCQRLLAMDQPEALVLAILCDFKGRDPREVVRYILQRLRHLTGANESLYRNYISTLETLSTIRGLETIIEEEEKMLTQVDQTRLPSYRIGHEKGHQEGVKAGEATLLLHLITRKFGSEAAARYQDQIESATPETLLDWSDRILTATRVEEMFGGGEGG